jgi:hypothetical protein
LIGLSAGRMRIKPSEIVIPVMITLRMITNFKSIFSFGKEGKSVIFLVGMEKPLQSESVCRGRSIR